MLSKTIAKTFLQRSSPILGATAARGVYTDETRPYVFINEHTKVICQGMTGKHVSQSLAKVSLSSDMSEPKESLRAREQF